MLSVVHANVATERMSMNRASMVLIEKNESGRMRIEIWCFKGEWWWTYPRLLALRLGVR